MEKEISFYEYCRLFYIVKGHLNTNRNTIIDSYDGFFRRVWYDLAGEDISLYLEGFEEEYEKNVERRSREELK